MSSNLGAGAKPGLDADRPARHDSELADPAVQVAHSLKISCWALLTAAALPVVSALAVVDCCRRWAGTDLEVGGSLLRTTGIHLNEGGAVVATNGCAGAAVLTPAATAAAAVGDGVASRLKRRVVVTSHGSRCLRGLVLRVRWRRLRRAWEPVSRSNPLAVQEQR